MQNWYKLTGLHLSQITSVIDFNLSESKGQILLKKSQKQIHKVMQIL